MMKVIIAEDELIIARAYERFLSKHGFEVKTMRNGELLLEAYEAFNPDVFILDMQLGSRYTGAETAAEIRKKTNKPIVFVTGNSQLKVQEETRNVANSYLLIKPVDNNELLNLLNSFR